MTRILLLSLFFANTGPARADLMEDLRHLSVRCQLNAQQIVYLRGKAKGRRLDQWLEACEKLRAIKVPPAAALMAVPELIGEGKSFMDARDGLNFLGFAHAASVIREFPRLLLMPTIEVRRRLTALGSLGVRNPVAWVTLDPSMIVHVSEFRGRNKLKALARSGFKDPVNLLERYPKLITLDVHEEINPWVEHLKKQGVVDPQALIEVEPRVLEMSKDAFDLALSKLRRAGFVEPLVTLREQPELMTAVIDRRLKPAAPPAAVLRLSTEWLGDQAEVQAWLQQHPTFSFADFTRLTTALDTLAIPPAAFRGASSPLREALLLAPTQAFRDDETGLAALAYLGFGKPEPVWKRVPNVKEWGPLKLIERMAGLAGLGFESPALLIAQAPTLLKLTTDTIAQKLTELSRLGFKNPRKLVRANAKILTLDIPGSLARKIESLRGAGFPDPIDLLERWPPMASLDVDDNVEGTLASLKDLGFKNTVGMVDRLPMLAAMSIEGNVQPTLRALLVGWGFDLEKIEERPDLLSFSLTRMTAIRQFLVDRGFDVRTLPVQTRITLIRKFTVQRLKDNLRRVGHLNKADQRAAFQRDPVAAGLFSLNGPCEIDLSAGA